MRAEEPRTIELRRADGRLYAITLGATLFHAHAFTIARGRAGAALVRRIEEFVTPAQLASRWRELVARRRRHGYQEIGPCTSTPSRSITPSRSVAT